MSSSERFSITEPMLCKPNNGVWFVYFDIIDNFSGNKVRKQYRGDINRFKGEERIKRANTVLKGFKNAINRGWNPLIEQTTVKLPIHYTISEGFERILEIKNATNGKRSKETYSYIVKFFKEWLEKNRYQNLYLKEFTLSMANQYMDYLIHSRGYAARTHNDHLIILKTFYNAMIEREWVFKSPFRKIKKLPTTIGRNLAYSESEREELKTLLYAKDRDMYYFSQIMYYCFIRRSELALLKISAFDLENHTITIPADVSKNRVQESVVIPIGLESVLKEMQLENYSVNDYIFGRHLKRTSEQYKNPNHISSRHNKFLKQLNIDRQKGLYSWKHTGACKAYYATGKDIYALMRQLRHRDLNTTQIYLKSLGLIQNDVFRNAMVA